MIDGAPERISDADRALLHRLTVRQRSTAELEALVSEHLVETYGLKPGDTVQDDGAIVRALTEPEP